MLQVVDMCEGNFSEVKTEMELMSLQKLRWTPGQPMPVDMWDKLVDVLRAAGLSIRKSDGIADAVHKLDGMALSAVSAMSWEQLAHVSESGKEVLKAAGLLPSTGQHLLDVLGYMDAEDLEVRICNNVSPMPCIACHDPTHSSMPSFVKGWCQHFALDSWTAGRREHVCSILHMWL